MVVATAGITNGGKTHKSIPLLNSMMSMNPSNTALRVLITRLTKMVTTSVTQVLTRMI